jgi:FKBP-type peptidyl-prolyl cis-trans isomerase
MRYLCCLILLSLSSCNDTDDKKSNPPIKQPSSKDWSEGHSIDYHTEVNEREQLSIAFFLEQHKELNMVTTSSGLRYQIIQSNPKGIPGIPEKTALFTVKVRLLDGKLCYESDENFYEELKIDHNDRESGLNEALKLMKTGEKAKLILPNHLAHGLVGDLKSIPPLSILIVDLELHQIQ